MNSKSLEGVKKCHFVSSRHCEERSDEAISDEKYEIASLLSVARNDRTRFFHSFLIFTIIFLLMSTFALAGISVDPVTLEVVTPKGGDSEGTFKISNTGNNPVRVRVELNKWTGTDTNIKSWVNLEPMDFELAPGGSKDVAYKITIPEQSIGELRCMVFFVADELGENKSPIGIRFGVPIYAAVGGTEVIDADIDRINVKYDIDRGILSGTILVNNKSNVHIRPHIEITIFDSKGDLVARFSPQYGQPAQRKQIRSLLFQQSLNLAAGKYKLVANVDYGRLYGLKDKVAEKRVAFIVKAKEEDHDKEKDYEKER